MTSYFVGVLLVDGAGDDVDVEALLLDEDDESDDVLLELALLSLPPAFALLFDEP